MSIEDEIVDRVARRMLYAHLPLAKGDAPERALFVAEALWKELRATYDDADFEYRLGELQAHLDVFASGAPISPKYLFLLYPAHDGVWEIRSPDPDYSIRVLGLFAGRDVFVATNMALRKDLGGWQDRRWKEVKRRAAAAWRTLFFTERPLVTTHVNEVASGAENGRYYKERG